MSTVRRNERRYWKIAPGGKGFLWAEQRDSDCIAVGWSDVGPLEKYHNNFEKGSRFDRNFKKLKYTQSSRQLIKFYRDVAIGDKVVASSGKYIYGIGEISRNYRFNEDLEYSHSKPVNWAYVFWEPLDITELNFNDSLTKRLNLQRTILELSEEEWDKIEKRVKSVKSPFKNRTEWKGMLRSPVYEHEVIILFSKISEYLGMKIEVASPSFPDALLRLKKGKKWIYRRAEFEINSANFVSHKHLESMRKGKKCDMIICWKHDWKRIPKKLQVIELRKKLEKILTR